MTTHRFGAMGCEVLVAGAAPDELAAIRTLFAKRDAVFSRFRPDSELSRVNAAAGPAVALSPLFADTLRKALWAVRITGGLVDPTLGDAVEAAGYDRDFAQLEPSVEPARAGAPGCWRSLRLYGSVLLRPAGTRLDLNGVVKALAVDDAAALLSGPGFVSAGGDLAARGEVGVALPGGGVVRLVAGGIATSGSTRRRWVRGGTVQHHLIEPRTGRPSSSPWAEVTVAGASCLHADVAAKAAFLAGEEGPAWLDERGLPGRFLQPDGSFEVNEAWAARLAGRAVCT